MKDRVISNIFSIFQLSESDRSKIEEAIDDKIKWLELNQDADGESFQKKKKELEDIAQPIIAKLYQASGGMPPPPSTVPGDEDDAKDEL